jgi:hypothetical protein
MNYEVESNRLIDLINKLKSAPYNVNMNVIDPITRSLFALHQNMINDLNNKQQQQPTPMVSVKGDGAMGSVYMNITKLSERELVAANNLFCEAGLNIRDIVKEFMIWATVVGIGIGGIVGYNKLEQNDAINLHKNRFNDSVSSDTTMTAEQLVDYYIEHNIPEHFTSRDYIPQIREALIPEAQKIINGVN